MLYYRPVLSADPARPKDALSLAGSPLWFDRAELLVRGQKPTLVAAHELPADIQENLTAPRAPVAGLSLDRPRVMGILNITPDSFSDGGAFYGPEAALAQARLLLEGGADILDIGAESTRPGATEVPVAEETARITPVIAALRHNHPQAVLSVDTRKAQVADHAVTLGARMINDVSAFEFDANMAQVIQHYQVPVCLMHTQGSPQTMQDNPHYDDVLPDVYDYLHGAVLRAMAAGIPKSHIMVDPGIGFGKSLDHNLALLRGIALFHGLGCPILLGASRKRFIGTLAQEPDALRRTPGSLAVALAGVAQGVQVLRVHDVWQTRQAITLWRAVMLGETG